MLFEIIAPVFKCAVDEDIFLSRLRALPGYERIIESGRTLRLTISDGQSDEAGRELPEICDTWHTTFEQRRE